MRYMCVRERKRKGTKERLEGERMKKGGMRGEREKREREKEKERERERETETKTERREKDRETERDKPTGKPRKIERTEVAT